MKVSGSKSGGVSKSTGKPASRAQTPRKDNNAVESAAPVLRHMGADAVEVSDHATTIEIIKGLVDAAPDIRAGEVERIAKQLKNGTYKIDYEKVADAFIRDVIANEIAKKPRKN